MRFGISDRLSSMAEDESGSQIKLIEALLQEPEIVEVQEVKKSKTSSRKRAAK
jgi:hypothetical protein